MDDLIALLPLVTVFLLFYIILYIPQRRRQKKHKSYIEALKKAGIKNPRPLPVANKTVGKKTDILSYYSDEIKDIYSSHSKSFQKNKNTYAVIIVIVIF